MLNQSMPLRFESLSLTLAVLTSSLLTWLFQEIQSDGVLVVEIYFSSHQSVGDLLCTQGLATRPSMSDLQLYRTPDGHSGSDDDDKKPFYAPPATSAELPQRKVVVLATNASIRDRTLSINAPTLKQYGSKL